MISSFDIFGNPSDSSNSPVLAVSWGKAFDDIYCHHAIFKIPFNSDSLFQPELAKVTVCVRNNVIEKGIIKTSFDKNIVRFLPCSYNDGLCIIPLNSTEIIDSLCEISWTTLKDGKKGAPKSYPLSITIELEGFRSQSYTFAHDKGKFPFTICEHLFMSLQNSHVIDTFISF